LKLYRNVYALFEQEILQKAHKHYGKARFKFELSRQEVVWAVHIGMCV